MKRREIKSAKVHTLYGEYLCRFEPDEEKGFIVTVPGLKGVITWGRTVEQAKKMVKEAIELSVECSAEKHILEKAREILKKNLRASVAA